MQEEKDSALNFHQSQPVLMAGASLAEAQAAMIMVHGRGATARDILLLSGQLNLPGFSYLAPEALGNTWYPYSFLAPIASNEPWLSSALSVIEQLLTEISHAGISPESTLLLGFSQGACLALEFAARHARRYGGVAGLSGGLIGPEGTPRNYPGSLEGTPIFLGCSDVDPHIPSERVQETAEILKRLGGEVTMRLYPNMEHTINQDEIDFIRSLMSGITQKG